MPVGPYRPNRPDRRRCAVSPRIRRASAARRALGVTCRLVLAEAGQRALAVLALLAADLARERDPLQPRDLPLAFDARRIPRRQRRDQLADPVAQLKREVRRRGAHQLAHVLDGHAVLGSESVRLLGFGHRAGVYAPSPLSTGWISS